LAEAAQSLLTGWESFYVIVGSSAAALTGLQFVVIALVAEVRPKSSNAEIDAFATPTIVHFCIALLTSAMLSAPWRDLSSPAIAIGLTGLVGILYAAIVIRRARRQTGYQPVFEDWLWHACLPVVAYASMVGAAVAIPAFPESALFVIGAASLLLVFIGIHNAWDTVTFITLTRVARPSGTAAPESGVPETPEDTPAS
jgi:xanthosine utilization system XapX-like protein